MGNKTDLEQQGQGAPGPPNHEFGPPLQLTERADR